MSRRLITSTIQWALLCSSCTVFAEDVPTVVVSATRSEASTVTVPASIKVISRSDITQSGASNLAEVLRANAGLQINDLLGDGTHVDVVMRGLDSTSNVLILVNGRRLNNVDLSSPDFGSISLEDVERIEIVQGSAGTLYGDQAVGGVINIITNAPAKGVSASVAAGSFGRKRIQLKICGDATDKLAFCYSEDALHAENYRDNNKKDDRNSLFHGELRHDDGKFFLEHQRNTRKHELPGGMTAADANQDRTQSLPEFVNDYSNSEVEVLRGGVQQSLGKNWALEMEIMNRDENISSLASYFLYPATFVSTNDNKQIEYTPRLIGGFDSEFGDIIVTIGVDIIKTKYDATYEYSFYDDQQKQKSIYAQVVYPFAPSWSLVAGMRHAKVEDDLVSSYVTDKTSDKKSVGEFGVSWQIMDEMRLFSRVDKNFRFAKVDELGYVSPGDKLKAQSGESLEFGAQWTNDALSWGATLYRLSLEDEIAFDPTAPRPIGGPFAGANVNLDSTIHDGMMIDANYKFTQSYAMAASFAYTDAYFKSGVYKDKKLSGVAPRILTVAPVYKGDNGIDTRLEFVFTDAYYASGDNDNVLQKADAYSLLNASAAFRQQGWSTSIRINNLLNKKYNESVIVGDSNYDGFNEHIVYPANEINFWLTVTVDIK